MIVPDGNAPPYNLWTEPWISLEQAGGSLKNLGIHDILLRAHEYIAIYDPSPLVVVGIHRLLVAILQDALQIHERADLVDLWEDILSDPSCPRYVQAIERFGMSFAHRFDLFSATEPFMQSVDLPERLSKKDKGEPVARLFVETPSGTETTHYRHITEDEHVFSPATIAKALVTIPAFVTSGGPGLMPSINGAPPIYIMIGGRTLLESLLASLIPEDQWPHRSAPNRAWWKREPIVEESKRFTKDKEKEGKITRSSSKQLTQVNYLHGLTFPARKIRVYPERVSQFCTRSGEYTEWGVRHMLFKMGESLLEVDETELWRDPFLAYQQSKDGIRPKPIQPQKGKALWREFEGLFLQNKEGETLRPLILEVFTSLDVGMMQSIVPVRCVSFLTVKNMSYLEWADFGFDIPPTVLKDVGAATTIKKALNFTEECAACARKVFHNRFCKTKSKKSERNKTLKERLQQEYWMSLEQPFREFISRLGDRSTRTQELLSWGDKVVANAKEAFDHAIQSVNGDGQVLRKQVESRDECSHELNKKRKKIQKEFDQGVKKS